MGFLHDFLASPQVSSFPHFQIVDTTMTLALAMLVVCCSGLLVNSRINPLHKSSVSHRKDLVRMMGNQSSNEPSLFLKSSLARSLPSFLDSEGLVPCLFQDLSSALFVLRFLRESGEFDGEEDVDEFFAQLSSTEKFVRTYHHTDRSQFVYKPTVVVVEGLDGTGKSTLAANLASRLSGTLRSTPTASLKSAQRVFDERGGIAARAFYQVSNYILMHEMVVECQRKRSCLVFVVDRWYSSTCAYTTGKAVKQGREAVIDALPASLFSWPTDLLPPTLLIILKLDEAARRARVQSRADLQARLLQADANDAELQQDADMGARIQRALERMAVPRVCIDAEPGPSEVLGAAEEAYREFRARCESSWPPFRDSRPVTLVLFGPHTSGKLTLGERVASKMGWRFDPELGYLLRTRNISANGHRGEEGASKDKDSYSTWDDEIFRAETARDCTAACGASRVVETWHCGNLLWALQRNEPRHPDADPTARAALIARTRQSVWEEVHFRHRRVVLVLLTIDKATMVRRRRAGNVSHLPMTHEEDGCEHLHRALGVRAVELFPALPSASDDSLAMHTPLQGLSDVVVRHIANNRDGEEEIEAMVNRICALF